MDTPKRNAALRPIGLLDALVPIFFISLLVVQARTFAVDPGVGWHLKTGEWILQHGRLPQQDPFLSMPRPWVVEQWLAEAVLAWLFQIGSWPLLYALLAVMYLGAYVVLLYNAALRSGAAALLCACAVAYAFKLGQTHFLLRPVIFSFPLFALVYGEAYRLYRAASADPEVLRKQYRHALLLVPVAFVLWANLHPSFFIGLAVLAALPVSLWLDRLLRGRAAAPNLLIARFSLLFLIGALAVLLNPYGYRLYQNVIALGQSGFAMRFYDEWQSPDFRGFEGFLFEMPIALIALSLFISRAKGLRCGFFEASVLLGTAHLSLQAARMLPYFAIAAAIPLADALQTVGPVLRQSRSAVLRRLSAAFQNLERREARSWRGQAPFWLCTAALLLYVIAAGRLPLFSGELGPPSTEYPYGAVDFLKTRAGSGRLAVANAMEWGGFITWRGAPALQAIIDDRTVLLGDRFYEEYFAKMRPGADWRGYVRELGASVLLLRSDAALTNEIGRTQALPLLYRDQLAAVFQVE